MKLSRLTRNALLTAAALIIFAFEMLLPSLSPVPGLKLGLSNIVTVYAVFALGPADGALILAARILLGAFISGNPSALMYSAAGGAACLWVLLLLRGLLTKKQVWVSSVLGAAAHNLGQLTVAVLVTRTPALYAYLPVLVAGGMLAGLFTGICAQLLINRADLK